MNRSAKLILLFAIGLACAKKQVVAPPTEPEEAFNQAMAYFETKRYDKAASAFQRFVFNFPGSLYTGDAQFYLAESYFAKRDYHQAMREYDFLLRNFTSTHREEAEYKWALCHYLTSPPYYKDQSQTLKAQELLETFIAKHLQSPFLNDAQKTLKAVKEKLARKEYEVARLYLRYDELNSALVYISYLKETYPDADYTAQAKFLLASYYERKGETTKAAELYEELLKTDNSVKKRVEKRLSRLKR